MATATAAPPAATSRLAPAGPRTATKMESIDAASPEVKQLVRQLNSYATATTLEEHAAALRAFDEDVTVDTPFLQVQGRDRVKVLTAFYKWFLGRFEIEPRLVKISVERPDKGTGLVEVDSIVHWRPHRPWWLPLTLLLPRDNPIYADVSMGVKAHNDKIYFVSGKNHNMPHVPRLLRVLFGYVAGIGAAVAEPTYNTLSDWFASASDTVSHPSNITDSLGSWGATVREGLGGISHRVTDSVGRVTHVAHQGAEAVRHRAAESAEALRQKAADVTKAAPVGSAAPAKGSPAKKAA